MTIRCDGCRYWWPDKADDPAKDWEIKGIGQCKKAIEFRHATVWVEDKKARKGVRKSIRAEYIDQMLFCADAGLIGSFVLTRPAFFCAHHKPVNEG